MSDKNSITILVIALGAWGKGETYEEALANCIKECGPQNVYNMHVVYACTDPGCTVDGYGGIRYAHGTVNTKVMALRHGRFMKPIKPVKPRKE
jgi:hypothetical protein